MEPGIILSISAIITFLTTPFVIRLAIYLQLVDDPKKRYHPAHTHTGIIPRAGGLAILIGIIIPMFLFIPPTKKYIGIILSSILLTIVGLCDDRKDIHPFIRIGTNILAALIVIAGGIGIPYITNPFTSGVIHFDTIRYTFWAFGSYHSILVIADIVAFIWLMWTINIVGWSAGVEGQMPGYVAISAFILGILSLRYSINDPTQFSVTLLAFIVSGAFLGFIPWNFFPQKIMPGYGGKTLAGLLLGILGILSWGKLGTALLVLGIPTVDAMYTLIRRISRGKIPVWADRGHLHHRLLDLGWGKRRIALFYWVVSAILGAIALTVTSKQKTFLFLLVAVAVGGFLLWIRFFTEFSKPQDPDNG